MFRKSGAGLFGALQHVDLTAIAEMRERRGYDMDEDDEELSVAAGGVGYFLPWFFFVFTGFL